jgi:hypothetical protein
MVLCLLLGAALPRPVMATCSRLSWGATVTELWGRSPSLCGDKHGSFCATPSAKSGDIGEELQCLSEWCSLLKERAASEKQKAAVKRARMDKMELLLNQEQVAIDLLDAKAKKLMDSAKELYADAEAHAEAIIKQEEEMVDVSLERRYNERLSREVNLNTREAALGAE